PLPAFLRQTRADVHNKFIDLEWVQRERLHQGLRPAEAGGLSPWARACGDEVMRRNRYSNVDPYLQNRVRLRVPEGCNDYINASPIRLVQSDGEGVDFIATQGPKENVLAHMWRMVWHETANPAVIVMLTQTHESGREKCFPYFPEGLGNPCIAINDEFGDGFAAQLTLKSIEEDPLTRSTVRELELRTKDGLTKRVWHLLFAGWPDFLVPEGEDRTALLRLVRLSEEKNAVRSSPRIVHCSAGVGRSGTFIALDWLMRELDLGMLDSIPATRDPVIEVVERMRQQRMMMVQAAEQFWFLYDVLRTLWVERW
ncbi:receptor/non-receptor type protein-tyrosine phosphatase, partial [Trichodelitschia bisporula]